VGNLGEKFDVGGMVRIRSRDLEFEMENTTFVGSSLRASDIGVPNEEIVFEWSCGDSNSRDFLLLNLLKILHKSLGGKSLSFFASDSPK
jgi:hypothetical protein